MCCWCSLEISAHLLLPYLSSLRIRNDFTDPLLNVCTHYMSAREDSSLLRELREPVWSNIIDVCSSFSARDCNVCFSQIFEKRTFGYPDKEEESLFMTLRTFNSFCSSCSNFVTLSSFILLTVVTVYGLNCANCDAQTTEPVLRNHSLRKNIAWLL